MTVMNSHNIIFKILIWIFTILKCFNIFCVLKHKICFPRTQIMKIETILILMLALSKHCQKRRLKNSVILQALGRLYIYIYICTIWGKEFGIGHVEEENGKTCIEIESHKIDMV